MPGHKIEDVRPKILLKSYKEPYFSDSVEILREEPVCSSGSSDADTESDNTTHYGDVLAKYSESDDSSVVSRYLALKQYANDETLEFVDEKYEAKANTNDKLGCAKFKSCINFSEEESLQDFKEVNCLIDETQYNERLESSLCNDNDLGNVSVKSESNTNESYTDKTLDSLGSCDSFRRAKKCSTPSISGEDIPLEESWVSGVRCKEEDTLFKPQDKDHKTTIALMKNGQVLSTKRIDDDSMPSPSQKKACCNCCGPVVKLVFGVLLFAVGILTLIWTPLEFLMKERLQMTPGLPAYEWWANPPDDVFLKFYAFNITNSESFLNGSSKILNFTEVGPVVYKEKLSHSNIKFNDNGTMTYTARRWLEFLPEYNKHIDLNATLVLPNLAVLGLASYLHDSNYFVKQGFCLMVKIEGSLPIVKTTIYNYMWNFSDPLLTAARDMAPGMVPVSNMGMLQSIYRNFTDTATVYIGSRWGDKKFFSLDNFDGSSDLPGFKKNECKDSLRGSTEGLIYSQRLDNTSKLDYWRKTLCKVVTLHYEDELEMRGMKAFRFTLPENAYHRTGKEDCYAGSPQLLDGLSDVSKCYFNFPMAMSLPHFRGTNPSVFKKIVGLKPSSEEHASYAIVEPNTGVPLESCARSQSNLVIRPLKFFNKDIQLFSDMVLPMFWAEYSQLSLPNYIWNMTIFTVLVMPVAQKIFSGTALIVGLALIFRAISQFCNKRSSPTLDSLTRNVILGYEKAKQHEKLER